jgi:hypothetical protein
MLSNFSFHAVEEAVAFVVCEKTSSDTCSPETQCPILRPKARRLL